MRDLLRTRYHRRFRVVWLNFDVKSVRPMKVLNAGIKLYFNLIATLLRVFRSVFNAEQFIQLTENSPTEKISHVIFEIDTNLLEYNYIRLHAPVPSDYYIAVNRSVILKMKLLNGKTICLILPHEARASWCWMLVLRLFFVVRRKQKVLAEHFTNFIFHTLLLILISSYVQNSDQINDQCLSWRKNQCSGEREIWQLRIVRHVNCILIKVLINHKS